MGIIRKVIFIQKKFTHRSNYDMLRSGYSREFNGYFFQIVRKWGKLW